MKAPLHWGGRLAEFRARYSAKVARIGKAGVRRPKSFLTITTEVLWHLAPSSPQSFRKRRQRVNETTGVRGGCAAVHARQACKSASRFRRARGGPPIHAARQAFGHVH